MFSPVQSRVSRAESIAALRRSATHLAGVSARLAARAHEAVVQPEEGPEPGLSQPALTLGVGDDGQVHLPQDLLVGARRACRAGGLD